MPFDMTPRRPEDPILDLLERADSIYAEDRYIANILYTGKKRCISGALMDAAGLLASLGTDTGKDKSLAPHWNTAFHRLNRVARQREGRNIVAVNNELGFAAAKACLHTAIAQRRAEKEETVDAV